MKREVHWSHLNTNTKFVIYIKLSVTALYALQNVLFSFSTYTCTIILYSAANVNGGDDGCYFGAPGSWPKQPPACGTPGGLYTKIK